MDIGVAAFSYTVVNSGVYLLKNGNIYDSNTKMGYFKGDTPDYITTRLRPWLNGNHK